MSASGSDYEMDSDVEEQAKSLTTCSICMDKFEDPKVLPCQHTFCLKCIKLCYEATNNQRQIATSNFPCPTCRAYCYIPSKGIEALASDFRIGQIVDLLNAIENSIQIQQQQKISVGKCMGFGSCSICRFQKRNRSAEAFCLQCEKSFCTECLEQHNNTTIFREHSMINANENKQIELNNKCSSHDYELKYFCEQCERLMCTVCVLSEHAGHTLIDQTTAFNRYATKLKNITNDFSLKRAELSTRLENLQQSRFDYTKECEESERMIRKAASDAKLRMLQIENELVTKINDAYNEKNYAITSYEQSITQAEENARRICENISQAMQITCSKAFFEKYSELINQVDQFAPVDSPPECTNWVAKFLPNICVCLGEIESESAKNLDVAMESSFVCHETELSETVEEKIEVISRKRDSQGNNLINGRHNSTNTSFKYGLRDLQKAASSDRIIGGLERRLSGRLSLSSSFSSSGSSLIGSRKKLKWVSESFQNCRDCCFVNLDGTWYIYASEYSKNLPGIKFFNLKGKLIGDINLRGMASPWSLCYNQTSKAIIVADQKTRAIRMIKLDRLGKCNKMITLAQLDQCEPRGLAFTLDGDYVISDANNERSSNIHVYTPTKSSSSYNTTLLSKKNDFAKMGDNEGEVLHANYVVVDHQNRIVVSDEASNHVKIFNLCGQQLVKFSCSCSFDGKDMVPQGLAIDSNNNILVADQATCNVSMYNPDGQLISSIVTTRGVPWGIAYLEEEKLLAVCTDKGLEMYSLKVV